MDARPGHWTLWTRGECKDLRWQHIDFTKPTTTVVNWTAHRTNAWVLQETQQWERLYWQLHRGASSSISDTWFEQEISAPKQGCSLGLERLGLEAVSRRFFATSRLASVLKVERLGLVSVLRVQRLGLVSVLWLNVLFTSLHQSAGRKSRWKEKWANQGEDGPTIIKDWLKNSDKSVHRWQEAGSSAGVRNALWPSAWPKCAQQDV